MCFTNIWFDTLQILQYITFVHYELNDTNISVLILLPLVNTLNHLSLYITCRVPRKQISYSNFTFRCVWFSNLHFLNKFSDLRKLLLSPIYPLLEHLACGSLPSPECGRRTNKTLVLKFRWERNTVVLSWTIRSECFYVTDFVCIPFPWALTREQEPSL